MTPVVLAMDRFSERLAETEKQLRAELNAKMETEVAGKKTELSEAYQQERLRYEREIQELKTALHRELEEEREALQEERKALEALIAQARSIQPKFGPMEDDTSPSASLSRHPSARTLFATLDEKHSQAFDSLQNKLETDLSAIRSSVAASAAQERAELQSRLGDQVEALMNALKLEERKNRELQEQQKADRAERERLEKQVAEIVERGQKEWRERDSKEQEEKEAERRERENKERREEEEKRKREKQEQERRAKEEKDRLERDRETQALLERLRDRVNTPPPASAWSIEEPKEARSDPWDRMVQLLKEHKHSPLPDHPLIKSLYPHPYAAIRLATHRATISEQADAKLSRLGAAPDLASQWGLGVRTEAALDAVEKALTRDREAMGNEVFWRMRQLLEEQADSIVQARRKEKGGKPPPIVTKTAQGEAKAVGRGDRKRAATDEMTSRESAASSKMSASSRGGRPSTTTQSRPNPVRANSAPPATANGRARAVSVTSTGTPRLGGWKYPSLKKGRQRTASNASDAVDWTDDYSEFSGSDEDDVIGPSESDGELDDPKNPPTPSTASPTRSEGDRESKGLKNAFFGASRKIFGPAKREPIATLPATTPQSQARSQPASAPVISNTGTQPLRLVTPSEIDTATTMSNSSSASSLNETPRAPGPPRGLEGLAQALARAGTSHQQSRSLSGTLTPDIVKRSTNTILEEEEDEHSASHRDVMNSITSEVESNYDLSDDNEATPIKAISRPAPASTPGRPASNAVPQQQIKAQNVEAFDVSENSSDIESDSFDVPPPRTPAVVKKTVETPNIKPPPEKTRDAYSGSSSSSVVSISEYDDTTSEAVRTGKPAGSASFRPQPQVPKPELASQRSFSDVEDILNTDSELSDVPAPSKQLQKPKPAVSGWGGTSGNDSARFASQSAKTSVPQSRLFEEDEFDLSDSM
ncbi:hypothetical protein HK104_005314 [Borealophlyctis nickersoniae]|nr:hypothetical protein HK104_005314 [Borealophlyctis nickersoniae]